MTASTSYLPIELFFEKFMVIVTNLNQTNGRLRLSSIPGGASASIFRW